MSYHLYNTRGFILQTFGTGEADKTLRIFTEDLGMISVRAQAVRKPTSKLRPFLRELSLVRLVVVRGKNIWRLTDVFEIASFSSKKSPERVKLSAFMFSLVNRFVHGEEDNAKLFSVLVDAYEFLSSEVFTEDELVNFEALVALKILASLGYVGEDPELKPFLCKPFSKEILKEFISVRRDAVRNVNRALEASQL